jgi:hypothetical protein
MHIFLIKNYFSNHDIFFNKKPLLRIKNICFYIKKHTNKKKLALTKIILAKILKTTLFTRHNYILIVLEYKQLE